MPGPFIRALCVLVALGASLFGASAQAATLTIRLGGAFTGAVGVSPIGQVCSSPGPCTFTIATGTALRVAANSPSSAGVISGGTGDASACATSTCAFTLDTDSAITVNFNPGDYPSVSLALAGDGLGEVGSDNNRCQNFELGNSTCTSYYASGSTVTVEGLSMPLNLFVNFSGGTADAAGCTTTPCVFTLTSSSSVVANFAALASFSVSPSSATVNVGQMQAFTAPASFTNGGTRPLVAGFGSWFQQPSLTLTRFSSVGVVVNQRFYVAGGIVGGGPAARFESFDPASGTWAVLPSMPTPHSEFAGVALGGRIYVVGGHTDGGGDVATMEAYDVVGNTWTTRASLPAARSAVAAAAINGILYVVGGGQTALPPVPPVPPVASLDAYDPGTNAWTSRAAMPTARRGLVAAAVGGRLYVFGGADSLGDISPAVEVYDPVTNVWTAKTPLPTARAFESATEINGLIYALTLQGLEVYNPATDTWTTLDGMKTPRSSPAVGALDGRLWVAGGKTGLDNATQTAVLESFRPPETTWWSSNNAVATIGPNGPANALSVGTATIIARPGALDCTTTNQCGTLTVNDDGGAGAPRISISDAAVLEGNAGTVLADFTVTLSQPSGQTVTVQFATANNTATAPSDFSTAAGTLTFTPGDVSETVSVTVNGDVTDEPTETFYVNLANPSVDVAILDGQGVGHIIGDDTPISDPATVYRLRHPSIGSYLFTVYPSERDSASLQYGYIYEGICCNSFVTAAGDGRTELFRLYSGTAGEYFFTIYPEERDSAVSTYGYTYEGVTAYCHPSEAAAAPTAWYRLRFGNKHIYTIYASERDAAVANFGYIYEGVSCYLP